MTHGGKREGAGRKPSRIKRKTVNISLYLHHIKALKELGGSKWIQKQIEKYIKKS